MERASRLAALVAEEGPRADALPLEGAALRDTARRSQLIVNTTTRGMLHSASESAPRGLDSRIGPRI